MKYIVCSLSGNAHEVEALYPRVDDSGALWFFAEAPAHVPDRMVACFSSQYWSQFRPAPCPETAAPAPSMNTKERGSR